MLKRALPLLALLAGMILLAGCSSVAEPAALPQSQASEISELVPIQTVDGEGQVYRSRQPSRQEFRLLAQAGLKSVLNLRNYHSDKSRLRGTEVREYRLKTNAGSFTEEEIYDALKILRTAPRPILIHCWHGADRTGTVVAAYRITFQNWAVEDAIAEMMRPEYGHHSSIYPNLARLLRAVDWEQMRKRLELAE